MIAVSRRDVLRTSALLCGGLALAACTPSTVSTPTSVPASSPLPASAPVSPVPSVAAAPSLAPSPSPVVSASPAGALVPVRGAWVALVAEEMIFPMAYDGGYFQKYGIDFDLSYIQGSGNGIAGLVSHSLDTITVSGSAVVAGQLSGEDTVLVAGFVNQPLLRVMGGPDIASLDDLKGKVVAVSRVGSATDYFFWQTIIQQQGWSQDDLQYVSAGSVPGQIALVQTGAAQATAVSPPNDVAALAAGTHQVFDSATLNTQDEINGLVVPRDLITAHRDVVLNVTRACVEAIHRWKTDQDFTVQAFNKYLPSDDPQYAQVGWSAWKDVLPETPFPTREGVLNDIQQVASQNPAAASLDVDKTIDMSIVQELVDTGFIRQIYGS